MVNKLFLVLIVGTFLGLPISLIFWANWNLARDQVRDKVKPILDANGKVWVVEAGQSDFTHDWWDFQKKMKNDENS